MSGATGAGAAATAAAHHAHMMAIKASGAIVKMEPIEFQKILNKCEEPVVVYTMGGLFKKNHQYLTSYKGLFFFTKSDKPLMLPSHTEVVAAKSILIPGN